MIVEKAVEKPVLNISSDSGINQAYEALEMCRILKLPEDEILAAKSLNDLHHIHNDVFIKYEAANIKGTLHHFLTPPRLRVLIDQLIDSHDRIRIFLGDPYTGVDWMEEYNLIGTLSRSTGVLKIPYLIGENENESRSLDEGDLVKIIHETGKVLWKAWYYIEPVLRIIEEPKGVNNTEYWTVINIKDGNTIVRQATFTSYGKAASYIAHITGELFEYMHSLTQYDYDLKV